VLCQVLDAEDAAVLLSHLTPHLQVWTPTQLAAAVTSSLPCLGDKAPTDGQQFALLFAALGAAASSMSARQAAGVLVVLAQLPGYAPDAQVSAQETCARDAPRIDALPSGMELSSTNVWQLLAQR
jgi:hypothetical protein